MGVTYSREFSVSFDHLAHQKKRRDPDNFEPHNHLDDQLNTSDPYRQIEIIRTLAEDEIKLYSEIIDEYHTSIIRATSNRFYSRRNLFQSSTKGNLNIGKISRAIQRFNRKLLNTLHYSDEERKEIEEFQPEDGMIEISKIEIDYRALNIGWSLQLAKLTLECSKNVRTINDAINNYKNSNALRRWLQAKVLEDLPWKPNQNVIKRWLYDSN